MPKLKGRVELTHDIIDHNNGMLVAVCYHWCDCNGVCECVCVCVMMCLLDNESPC